MMPIVPNFTGGGGGGGIALPPVTNIIVQESSGKVYVRWTDPDDVTVAGSPVAVYAGTVLVRQIGRTPQNRHDGVSSTFNLRNGHQTEWHCDSGLVDGETYYYKFFPYSTDGVYTDDAACEFIAIPHALEPGDVQNLTAVPGGDGILNITWEDPDGQYPLMDAPVESLMVDIRPKQAGIGTPSPENIRAISGWTEANIVQTPHGDSYIRDGLIFHLDGISRGGEEDKWIDLVGGKVFTLNDVTEYDDSVYFKGQDSSYAVYDGAVSGNYTQETVEICVHKEGTTRAFVLSQPKNADTGNYGICAVYAQDDGYGMYYVCDGKKKSAKRIDGKNISDYRMVSMTSGGATCIDMERAHNGQTGSWGIQSDGKTYIGIRSPNFASDKRFPLRGNVYSVRIYNRRLSYEEMLHNQAVDNARFHMSRSVRREYHTDFTDGGTPLTVYGGRLNAVSGVLTVTHKYIDLGSLTWTQRYVGDAHKTVSTVLTDAFPYNGYSFVAERYPYIGPVTGVGSLSAPDDVATGIRQYRTANSSGNYKTLYAVIDKEAEKPEGAMVYKCTAQTTYQLTPHQMTAIIGANQFDADCGVATATYQAGHVISEWGSTAVVVKRDSYASSPTDVADGDGSFTTVSTVKNEHLFSPLAASPLENGTTYYISIFPQSTDGGINTRSVNRTTGVPGKLAIEAMPSQLGEIVYDGSPHEAQWNNYDEGIMTISPKDGVSLTQTNAGVYTACVTPTENYCWPDTGTQEPRDVTWEIRKCAPNVPALSTRSITLGDWNTSGEFTVTIDGNGTVVAESSNTSVATVSVSGNTVTVNSVGRTDGEAEITVYVGEGDNYLAYTGNDAKCSVTVSFIPSVLNDATWEQIRAVSDAGCGSSYWAVGDCKEIELNGQVERVTFDKDKVCAFIIGFDHNAEVESMTADGHGIHFQIGKTALTDGTAVVFTDSKYPSIVVDSGDSGFCMYKGQVEAGYDNFSGRGGWENSYMRTGIIGVSVGSYQNKFVGALPGDLREVMKPVRKYTDNVGDGVNSSGNVSATTDYVFLLSEYEVYGASSHANRWEHDKHPVDGSSAYAQKQYAYYEAGNSRGRFKYGDTAQDQKPVRWWLRSSDAYENSPRAYTGFVCVDSNSASYNIFTDVEGNAVSLGAPEFKSSYATDCRSLGFSPAFCV